MLDAFSVCRTDIAQNKTHKFLLLENVEKLTLKAKSSINQSDKFRWGVEPNEYWYEYYTNV